MNGDLDWTQTFRCDDGCAIYLNGKLIKAVATVSTNNNVTVPFKKGWNKFQIILREKTAKEQFSFASKITEEAQCLGIDCYHSENEFTEGYVPLVGNSTIEGDVTIGGTLTTTGNITSGGTVGVTTNAYLQYNESDKSISFIFN